MLDSTALVSSLGNQTGNRFDFAGYNVGILLCFDNGESLGHDVYFVRTTAGRRQFCLADTRVDSALFAQRPCWHLQPVSLGAG